MRRLLGILENEDPAYAMLHQAANFTGKRRAIRLAGGAILPDGFPQRGIGMSELVSHPAA